MTWNQKKKTGWSLEVEHGVAGKGKKLREMIFDNDLSFLNEVIKREFASLWAANQLSAVALL